MNANPEIYETDLAVSTTAERRATPRRDVPAPVLRDLERAAAAQAAHDAADLNWSHSVSTQCTPERSAQGSLYAAGAPGFSRSSRVDWSTGLGMIGALLALVASWRSATPLQAGTVLTHVLLASLAGVIVGMFVHAIAGRVFRRD